MAIYTLQNEENNGSGITLPINITDVNGLRGELDGIDNRLDIVESGSGGGSGITLPIETTDVNTLEERLDKLETADLIDGSISNKPEMAVTYIRNLILNGVTFDDTKYIFGSDPVSDLNALKIENHITGAVYDVETEYGTPYVYNGTLFIETTSGRMTIPPGKDSIKTYIYINSSHHKRKEIEVYYTPDVDYYLYSNKFFIPIIDNVVPNYTKYLKRTAFNISLGSVHKFKLITLIKEHIVPVVPGFTNIAQGIETRIPIPNGDVSAVTVNNTQTATIEILTPAAVGLAKYYGSAAYITPNSGFTGELLYKFYNVSNPGNSRIYSVHVTKYAYELYQIPEADLAVITKPYKILGLPNDDTLNQFITVDPTTSIITLDLTTYTIPNNATSKSLGASAITIKTLASLVYSDTGPYSNESFSVRTVNLDPAKTYTYTTTAGTITVDPNNPALTVALPPDYLGDITLTLLEDGIETDTLTLNVITRPIVEPFSITTTSSYVCYTGDIGVINGDANGPLVVVSGDVTIDGNKVVANNKDIPGTYPYSIKDTSTNIVISKSGSIDAYPPTSISGTTSGVTALYFYTINSANDSLNTYSVFVSGGQLKVTDHNQFQVAFATAGTYYITVKTSYSRCGCIPDATLKVVIS